MLPNEYISVSGTMIKEQLPKMNNVIFRGYQEGDEFNILKTFNQIFNEERKISHWYWKYNDHPWGKHYISLAVDPNGTIAAHYGGYPVRMTYCAHNTNIQVIKTVHLGDKMSRPEYRGLGFRKNGVLARTFFHFRNEYGLNVPFGIGFGTHHSLRLGLLLFDYMNVEKIPYRRATWPINVSIWSKSSAMFRNIVVNPVVNVTDEWTDFFDKVASHYVLLTTRCAQYLRWRYFKRPDKKYLMLEIRSSSNLVGWCVFSRNNEVLEWVDGLFDPCHAFSAGLAFDYLKGHPIADNARWVDCWFPSRPSWWNKALLQLGFKMYMEPNDLHLTGPVFSSSNPKQMLCKNFYYTMGDSDLF